MEIAYEQVYVISSRVLLWSIFRNIHIQTISLQYVFSRVSGARLALRTPCDRTGMDMSLLI